MNCVVSASFSFAITSGLKFSVGLYRYFTKFLLYRCNFFRAKMGKGFNNYMCKKFFHPASKENLKRVWMAQQKHDHEKKKQDDLQNQYQKEQEMYAHRALLGDEKAKLGLSFMYDAPAGANKQLEKEEGEPQYKFEWQGKYKAPREDYNKNDDSVQDQPFGIEVRNVRCIKCHKWGHMNTDKICPLFNEALTMEPPQPNDMENDLLRDLQEDGLRLKQVVMGRKNDPRAKNQQMIDSDDEDPESQFLKSLSDKQKKKLLKKIEKLQKKKKKKAPDFDDDDDEDDRKHHRHSDETNGHSSRRDRSRSPHRYHSPEKSRKRHHSSSPDRKSRRKESPRKESSKKSSERSHRNHQDSAERKESRRRRDDSQDRDSRRDRDRSPRRDHSDHAPKRSKRRDSSSEDERRDRHKKSKDSRRESPVRSKYSRHDSSSPEKRRR